MNAETHAAIRAQQRGIPPLIVQWLCEFGEEIYDGHGAVIRTFSHASRKALERAFGRVLVRKLAHYLNAYMVESSGDGYPITVGYRYRRVNRK